MDAKNITALVGVATGIFGYWFTTFSMQPILRYENIRNNILVDLIYYSQVINEYLLDEDMKKLYRERILSNRKTSAELTAATLDIQ